MSEILRKIKIVADSSCDLLTLDNVDFCSSPMKIITSQREFIDDKNLNIDEMVEFFDKYKDKSKSSCPNVSDWLNAFGDADDVICLTITSALSGSYNSACTAKKVFEEENEGKRVFVLDTLSTGPEMALIIRKIAEYIQSGMQFDEICENVKEYSSNTGLIFMLKSLKNFANNGRISPVVAKIVGIAGICIAGKASDQGTLEPTHKCRGEQKALETLLSDLEKYGLKKGRVSLGHCRNEKAAMTFKKMVEEKFKDVKVEIHHLRGLCCFYAEDGGLLVGYEKQ